MVMVDGTWSTHWVSYCAPQCTHVACGRYEATTYTGGTMVTHMATRNSVWDSAMDSLELVAGDDVLSDDDGEWSDAPLARMIMTRHCSPNAFSVKDCITLKRDLTELMPDITAHDDIDDEDKTNLSRLLDMVQRTIIIGGVLQVSG
jgi:hypothetical protein